LREKQAPAARARGGRAVPGQEQRKRRNVLRRGRRRGTRRDNEALKWGGSGPGRRGRTLRAGDRRWRGEEGEDGNPTPRRRGAGDGAGVGVFGVALRWAAARGVFSAAFMVLAARQQVQRRGIGTVGGSWEAHAVAAAWRPWLGWVGAPSSPVRLLPVSLVNCAIGHSTILIFAIKYYSILPLLLNTF